MLIIVRFLVWAIGNLSTRLVLLEWVNFLRQIRVFLIFPSWAYAVCRFFYETVLGPGLILPLFFLIWGEKHYDGGHLLVDNNVFMVVVSDRQLRYLVLRIPEVWYLPRWADFLLWGWYFIWYLRPIFLLIFSVKRVVVWLLVCSILFFIFFVERAVGFYCLFFCLF